MLSGWPLWWSEHVLPQGYPSEHIKAAAHQRLTRAGDRASAFPFIRGFYKSCAIALGMLIAKTLIPSHVTATSIATLAFGEAVKKTRNAMASHFPGVRLIAVRGTGDAAVAYSSLPDGL